MTEAEYDNVTAIVKANECTFKAVGKTLMFPGWTSVYKAFEPKDKDGEETTKIPKIDEGETLSLKEIKTEQKFTKPPARYNDATLVKGMEENGIGRPSTRAAIIETLFRRNYIRKERKSLWATPTGVELIGLIHEELLKSAELTGLWEKKLRQIERHEYEARTFLEELKQMVTELVNTVLRDNTPRQLTVEQPLNTKKKKKASTSNKKAK